VFVLNVGMAIATLVVLPIVPTSRDPHAGRIDLAGAATSAVGIGALVLAIIEGGHAGWTDPITLVAGAVAVVSLGAFVFIELRHRAPMLDVRLFRLRGFGSGSLSLTVQFFAAFGLFYLALQFLQYVYGYSPLHSAIALLPLGAPLMLVAPSAPRLADRFGQRVIGSIGLALMAVGFAVLSSLEPGTAYGVFAVGAVVLGTGMGLSTSPATTAIVRSLPEAEQGVASAMNDTTREVGGALGIALFGSLLASRYTSEVAGAVAQLPPEAARAAEVSLGGALGVADQLGGPGGAALADAARRAFVDGHSTATLAGAALLIMTAVVIAFWSPGRMTAPAVRDHEEEQVRTVLPTTS
jgi:predicted MFS family arabinose efflux permease